MEYAIRHVGMEDLDAVTQVEAECFPVAEAAGKEIFRQRIETFPECFFVAECDKVLIGFINGCATDERVIQDEMFEDCRFHLKEGIYQSVFGLDVMPQYRRQGIAAALMNRLIADARLNRRRGLILTCKERLIPYYETFGYENMGISGSVHGGAVWYDMVLEFSDVTIR